MRYVFAGPFAWATRAAIKLWLRAQMRYVFAGPFASINTSDCANCFVRRHDACTRASYS